MAYGEKKIKCLCPTCREHHSMKMIWKATHIEVPRKRCPKCKRMLETTSGVEHILVTYQYRD